MDVCGQVLNVNEFDWLVSVPFHNRLAHHTAGKQCQDYWQLRVVMLARITWVSLFGGQQTMRTVEVKDRRIQFLTWPTT